MMVTKKRMREEGKKGREGDEWRDGSKKEEDDDDNEEKKEKQEKCTVLRLFGDG